MCPRAPAKLKCFFLRRLCSTNIDCFVRDSSRLHLTYVAFCLLSVVHKQWLKNCNCCVNQSALLTGFWTDFTSSVWNFCCWVADVPPCETSPAMKSEEKRMFSQANTSLYNIITHSKYFSISDWLKSRAVKKFSSSRLIMNSRQLWNSHQMGKFLRARHLGTFWKFLESQKCHFQGFPRCISTADAILFRQNTSRIHTRLGTMPLKCPRHFTTLHGSSISQI